jgi:chromosomal replication initiator protein
MKKNFGPIWKNIAELISAQVSRDTFHRWFQAIELLDANEDELLLGVPNNIYQLWIESNYMPLVHSAIASVLGAPRTVRFSVDHEPQEENEKIEHAASVPESDVSEPTAKAASNNDALSGNGNGHGHAETARDAAPTIAVSAAVASNGMNPRNSFDTFVVGENNRFAHAAAQAVAQNPAKTYNPLFLWGGVGLGKTHLMQAIGQTVTARGKNTKVIYLSSEKFTNEFIDAIQNNALVKFRKRYRQADVLLIDDIQFLAGKERSQEEFFHTFNTLFDGHKQIVLSSDRAPSEISNLEARLVSRFEWGMAAQLQPPDVETRMAILQKKAESLSIKLDHEIIVFLAERIRNNIRRLEGALMRVASLASLSGKEQLSHADVEDVLKDILHEQAKRNVTIDQIQKKVAEHFDVRLADMTSKRRPANIAFPRQVAMFLAREMTKASLNEIGEAFGGRDHGTVLHAHRLVQERIKTEETTRHKISAIDSELSR